MLAVQMIGAQRTAMKFFERETVPGQARTRNVLRAVRASCVFNEHIETMVKLKGKGGQERVVVEPSPSRPAARRLCGVSPEWGHMATERGWTPCPARRHGTARQSFGRSVNRGALRGQDTPAHDV